MSAVFPWTANRGDVTASSPNYTASGSYTPLFPNVPPLPGVPALGRLSAIGNLAGVGGQAGRVVSAISNASEMLRLAQELGTQVGIIFGVKPLFAGSGLTPPAQLSYSITATNFGTVSLGEITTPFAEGNATAPGGTVGTYSAQAASPAIRPDSFIEADYDADTDVMTHPIEAGQFEAYNRVQKPKKVRLLLACQGVKMDRREFLTTLENMKEGTDLFTLSLPFTSVKNMTLKRYSFAHKSEHGAVTIWADTQWEEGRSAGVTVNTIPSSQPQGAQTQDLGSLSPQLPSNLGLAAITAPPVVPSTLPAFIQQEAPPSLSAF